MLPVFQTGGVENLMNQPMLQLIYVLTDLCFGHRWKFFSYGRNNIHQGHGLFLLINKVDGAGGQPVGRR